MGIKHGADGSILHKADGDLMHECCCSEPCTVDLPSCAGSDLLITFDYSIYVQPNDGYCYTAWPNMTPTGGVQHTLTYQGVDAQGNPWWRHRWYTNNYCVHHPGAWLTCETVLKLYIVHDPPSANDCYWLCTVNWTTCCHVSGLGEVDTTHLMLIYTWPYTNNMIPWGADANCEGLEMPARNYSLGVLIEPA